MAFEADSFDTVLACEIVEHLPFEDFKNILLDLKKIARKNVIIAIPIARGYAQFKFRFKYIIFNRKINKQFVISLKFPYFYKVIDIDGVRVLFEDGWGLVRASNTQPALVLRFEALSESRLSEIRNLVESVLADIDSSVKSK